jgi:hypothetical protein
MNEQEKAEPVSYNEFKLGQVLEQRAQLQEDFPAYSVSPMLTLRDQFALAFAANGKSASTVYAYADEALANRGK